MLRKTRKLNLAWSENQNFYRLFERRVGQFLQVYARKATANQTTSRSTVVVGKKVSKLSTRRNQLKRQLYEFLAQLKIWQSGRNLIIVVKQATSPGKYLQELKQLLD